MIWWILAGITALLASSSMIAEKKVLVREHALELCTIIFIFGSAIMFLFIDRVNFRISLWLIGILYLVSWIEVFAFWFYTRGLRHMDISLVAPLLSFGPVIVVLLAFLILGEILEMHNVFGIGLVVLGSYVLQLNHKHINVLDPFRNIIKSKYIHYVFITILLWSGLTLFSRWILNVNNPLSIDIYTKIFFGYLFTAINFLILLTLFYDGYRGVMKGAKKYSPLIFLGAVLMVGAGIIYAKIVSVVMVSLLYPMYKGISTLSSTIFGGEYFHEKNLITRVLASIIMIIGIYFVVI